LTDRSVYVTVLRGGKTGITSKGGGSMAQDAYAASDRDSPDWDLFGLDIRRAEVENGRVG
jgi:hypothetical protein